MEATHVTLILVLLLVKFRILSLIEKMEDCDSDSKDEDEEEFESKIRPRRAS